MQSHSARGHFIWRAGTRMHGAAPLLDALALISALVAGGWWTVLFLVRARPFLTAPVVLDHVEALTMQMTERVQTGLPLYAAPDVTFIAGVYPPGLFYALAGWFEVFGVGLPEARALSLVASLLTALLICVIVSRRAGLSLGIFCGGLYLGTFGAVAYSHLLARADALFVLTVASAVAILDREQLSPPGIIAVLLLVLGVFLKQPGVIFLVMLAGYLVWTDRARGWRLLGGAGLLLAIGLAWAQRSSQGWFWFYAVEVPAQFEVDLHLLRLVLPQLVLGTVPAAFLIGVAGLLARGLAVGISGLWHQGGAQNVLMPLYAFLAVGAGLSLGEWRARTPRAAFWRTVGWPALLIAAVGVQTLTLAYGDPRPAIATIVARERLLAGFLSETAGRVQILRPFVGRLHAPFRRAG